jgi:tetratricopeptide (TPR) repeat protein
VDYQEELARTRDRLAQILGDRAAEEPATARNLQASREEQQRLALEIWEKLITAAPAVPRYRVELVKTTLNLAETLNARSRPEEAVRFAERARAEAQKLVDAFPAAPDARHLLALAHTSLASLAEGRGRTADAEEQWRRGLTIRQDLVAEYPDVAKYRLALATAHAERGTIRKRARRRADAEAEFSRALEVREKLATDRADVPFYACAVGDSYLDLGDLSLGQGEPASALGWYARAVTVLIAARNRGAGSSATRDRLRRAHEGRAVALGQLGRHAEEADDLAKAMAESTREGTLADLGCRRAVALALAHQHVLASAEAAEMARRNGLSGTNLYDLARACSLAAAAVRDDAALEDRYAGRAMELLRRARDAPGFDAKVVADELRTKPDFDLLRRRGDFSKLLADLAGGQNPY